MLGFESKKLITSRFSKKKTYSGYNFNNKNHNSNYNQGDRLTKNHFNAKPNDDVFVIVKLEEAKNGFNKFMLDTGAEISIIKINCLKNPNKINVNDKRIIAGISGTVNCTLGSITSKWITPELDKEISLKFHVVGNETNIPTNGIIGRDILWNTSVIDTINKIWLIINKENNTLQGTIPFCFESTSSKKDSHWKKNIEKKSNARVSVLDIIPKRVNFIAEIDIPDLECNDEIIITSQEIIEGVFLAKSISKVNEKNKVRIGIMNNNEHEVILPEFDLIYENFNTFEIIYIDENITSNDIFSVNVLEEIDSNIRNRFKLLEQSIKLGVDLNPEEKYAILSVCKSFHDVFFLENDKLTYTDVLNHTIPIHANHPAINQKNYRLPQIHRDVINEEVKEMLKNDIIVHSKSPWNSPLLVVPKKPGPDGEKRWRVVVDFRKLNQITIKDAFPLPRIEEILDQLGHSRYFSTLDLASGYHQVLVNKNDREKTAFSTGLGHFEFKRMPFGLTGAPATFQRIMNFILTGLQGIDCFVYIDDIVIYGKSLEQHNDRLSRVLSQIRKHNLKLQTEKCNFLCREVVYLGHKCSNEGALPDPRKIECVKNFPVPKTIRQVQSFLGLANYYRKFIPDFSSIAMPINKLMRKDVKFVWTEKCQKAFEKLREILVSPEILIYPDFNQPFILTTDASNEALGAVLSQGKIGSDRPISYASRILKCSEKNYSTTEKELLAIVWAVKNFRPYLLSRKFTIYTDHKPLKGIFNVKDPSSRLLRFHHKLSEYSYDIEYKPGKYNINADVLSRIPNDSQILKTNDNVEIMSKKSDTKPVGLINVHNSCYLNSVLQALFNLECFKNWISNLKIESYNVKNLTWAMSKVYEKMQKVSKPFIPQEIIDEFKKCFPGWLTGSHEDANEFFMYLLDEMTRIPNSKFTICQDFYGKEKRIKHCYNCKDNSENINDFNSFIINTQNNKSIEFLLNHYIQNENNRHVGTKCSNCKSKSKVENQWEIIQAPKVLVLFLNRTRNTLMKNHDKVIVSTFLKISCQEKNVKYKIKSIINHHGIFTDRGHYTTVINNENDQFFSIDDDQVEMIYNLYNIKTETYMLFYEKVENHNENIIEVNNNLNTSLGNSEIINVNINAVTTRAKTRQENNIVANNKTDASKEKDEIITDVVDNEDDFNTNNNSQNKTDIKDNDRIDYLPENEISKLEVEKLVKLKDYIVLTNQDEIDNVLKDFHTSPLGGHQGVKRTLDRIKREYRWKNMLQDIERFIKSCKICQANKFGPYTKMEMGISHSSSLPFERVYMDIVGPLNVTENNNKYILTFKDDLTKFFDCYALERADTKTVAEIFYNEIISRYRIPGILITDRGSNFTSDLFKRVCKLLKIKRILTSAYHPQSDSVERNHRDLASFLRIVVESNPKTWDKWLRQACHVYNNHIHTATKLTPMECLFGFTSEMPTNLKRDPKPLYNHDDYFHELKFKLQTCHKYAKQNAIEAKLRSKKYYDQNANSKKFKTGDKVWLKNETRKGKLDTLWNGPFEVINASDLNTEIKIKNRVYNVHNNRLKLCEN